MKQEHVQARKGLELFPSPSYLLRTPKQAVAALLFNHSTQEANHKFQDSQSKTETLSRKNNKQGTPTIANFLASSIQPIAPTSFLKIREIVCSLDWPQSQFSCLSLPRAQHTKF